ncbi:hypothetical protein HHK36_025437 [Tetracentron sinense]|uniref:GBF-interacting protein 1 N-terminal domain-containing protein n=1 Tax=Tetracentron sinense TaxID=13715 RepID=A0A835D5J1_TETSI|nr:hypothetical protein HHK36_025437 [Tetracentron sinense]
MISGPRIDGETQILSARVRKTIQSIKEIVGNHSEADIYVMLKETNMDPNETAQKLLNQGESISCGEEEKGQEERGYKGPIEPRKHVEHIGQGITSHTFLDRNARTRGYTRNALYDAGISREFRIVRDNRVNQSTNREIKPASHRISTSTDEQVISSVGEKSSTGTLSDQKNSGARNSDGQKSSQALNRPTDSLPRHAQDANLTGPQRKEISEETRAIVPTSASQHQGLKPHDSQPSSATLASKHSVVGVYSSSSDPVHVPSPDSRSSGVVGAIKREVGVVGVRRQSSENSSKHSSVPSRSFSNPLSGNNISTSTESFRPSTAISKSDQPSQTAAPESVISSMPVSRSFLSNQYSSKPHQQLMGHQKAPQPNMEWKPKSSRKSSIVSPEVIGTAAIPVSTPTDNSRESKTETAQLQERLSRVNVLENQHVIIPQHLRVPEADRTQLTFGSFGAGFDSTQSLASGFQAIGSAEESSAEPSAGESVSIPAASSDDASGGDEVDLLDEQARNSRSDSPASAAASEHPVPNRKESSSPRHSENYADIGLVRNDSPLYSPLEPQQQQDPPGLPSFSAYDPQTGYDVPFFRSAMEENVRGHSLSSSQEGLNFHAANSIPSSPIAMVQQQQQQMAQMYPQVHVSHFANVMPYRQFLSPVYVPPMAMPGYSSNPAYAHPSNGSSYLMMPGGSPHLTASGLKYGTQQFKPVPTGSPTGFGNFTSPAGYAINAPGAVGGATGLEDSTRIKYKEGNIYIPNPQAETSEMWIQNPRELQGLQSAQYYNMPAQAPHATYLPSHTGHTSFNAAAQSTHMQYPTLYHPPQQATIANPHHMVPSMGGNVGVGMAAAAPGAQVGAYQQPQLGRLNWTTNF